MTQTEILKDKYESACNDYVRLFCKKQGFDYSDVHWVGNLIGGIFNVADFYFNFDDVVWDINSKQRKGKIIKWYYDNIENPNKTINYYSYTKGLRVKDINRLAKKLD